MSLKRKYKNNNIPTIFLENKNYSRLTALTIPVCVLITGIRVISILLSNSQCSPYDVVSHSAPSIHADPTQLSFLGVHWSKEKEPDGKF